MDSLSPDSLRAALAARRQRAVLEWDARPAAVLVPLFQDAGAWQVLFTQRPQHMAEHSGQVAFPGGRADPADASRVETALRETEEEIGLARQDVTVLGALDELLTVTQYRVTPIVATFPWPYALRPSPREIESVFHAPLAWLADPGHREIKMREPPFGGPPIPVYYFRYQTRVIWGVTARIVVNLLDTLAE